MACTSNQNTYVAKAGEICRGSVAAVLDIDDFIRSEIG